MKYDAQAAEKLEAVYLGRDVVAQRAHTLALLDLQPGERVLDIGSGPGFLCNDMADAVGTTGFVHGVDISDDLLERAESRRTVDHLSYSHADATALPDRDGSFDVVVSTQVAEYVPDIAAFCAEAFRVLKPRGRALIVATDWDALTFYSEDPDRMNRVFRAFAPHCADPRLPRTLGRRMTDAGFAVEAVTGYAIVNTSWDRQNYSTPMMDFVHSYVLGRGDVSKKELDAWIDEQKRLSDEGRYFFLTTRIIFQARRPG